MQHFTFVILAQFDSSFFVNFEYFTNLVIKWSPITKTEKSAVFNHTLNDVLVDIWKQHFYDLFHVVISGGNPLRPSCPIPGHKYLQLLTQLIRGLFTRFPQNIRQRLICLIFGSHKGFHLKIPKNKHKNGYHPSIDPSNSRAPSPWHSTPQFSTYFPHCFVTKSICILCVSDGNFLLTGGFSTIVKL